MADSDIEELKARGINLNEPAASPQDEAPSFTKELVKSGSNLIEKVVNNPADSVRSFATGVRNSFELPSELPGIGKTGIPERTQDKALGALQYISSKLEGTSFFPLIQGAAAADRLFLSGANKQQFHSLREAMDNRIMLTDALRESNPELMEGAEIGAFVSSLPALGKSGLKLLSKIKSTPKLLGQIPKFYREILNLRAVSAEKKAIGLAENLMKEGPGPVRDALIDRPQEVSKILKEEGDLLNTKEDGSLINDLAVETDAKLKKVHKTLSEDVAVHREKFTADPTKRVDVTKPVEVPSFDPEKPPEILDPPQKILEDFKQSVTDPDTGQIAIKKSAQDDLRYIEKVLSGENRLLESGQFNGTISPKGALLLLDRIDGMIDVNQLEKTGDKVLKQNMIALIKLRKSLKYQIRGDNVNWFKADEAFSNFIEDYSTFKNNFGELRGEGFVSNLLGANKTELRKQITKLVGYTDIVDKKTGGGEAFFNRLANIRAAQNFKKTQMQVTRPIQENANEIVRRWRGHGQNIGTAAGLIGGALKLGKIDTTLVAGAIGRTLGAYALGKVGQQMANPQRILNIAMKSKELSKDANKLASDLSFIHTHFGNDGVISFLDVVGALPALNELEEFSNRISPQKGKMQPGGENARSKNTTKNP